MRAWHLARAGHLGSKCVRGDDELHRQLAHAIDRHAHRLRTYLDELGLRWLPMRARTQGRTLVDCSGSMTAGNNIERAKRFAVLVAEAVRPLAGVEARFFGFTDSVIYDAGMRTHVMSSRSSPMAATTTPLRSTMPPTSRSPRATGRRCSS